VPYTFCPHCGERLALRPIEGRELPACPACPFVFYNNSAPCVGVLVVDCDRVLLVKRAIEPAKGCWDVPGGFLESGEHPEAGAGRELREETGLEIELTALLGFFMAVYGEEAEPVLNICYLARATGGELGPGDDAAEAAWFALDAPPDDIAFTWVREALGMLAGQRNS
jgi:ADP-ribose pyrophosphatase YjhB (NUDIX family)